MCVSEHSGEVQPTEVNEACLQVEFDLLEYQLYQHYTCLWVWSPRVPQHTQQYRVPNCVIIE